MHEKAISLSGSILLTAIFTKLCRMGLFTQQDSVEVVEEAISVLKSSRAVAGKDDQKTYIDAIEFLQLMIERLGNLRPYDRGKEHPDTTSH